MREIDEHSTPVEKAEFLFNCLKTSVKDNLSLTITSMIINGEIFWSELSFTEDELWQEKDKCHIREGEHLYENLDSNLIAKENSIDEIINLLKNSKIFWSELSFTEDDLKQRIEVFYTRKAIKLYNSGDYYGVKKLLFKNKLDWKTLPFTEEDLEKQKKTSAIEYANFLISEIIRDCLNNRASLYTRLVKTINQNGIDWKELCLSEEKLKQEIKELKRVKKDVEDYNQQNLY